MRSGDSWAPSPAVCVGTAGTARPAGIRSWDIDLTSCNLDEQLKLFVSRHSATFSSIVKGTEVALWVGDGAVVGLSAGARRHGPHLTPWL